MIEQKFKCPNCGEISSFYGNPGEQLTVTCTICNSKGRVLMPSQARVGQNAIEVSHLKKIYGDLIAVNDISFAVKRGEVFAFLGPNGAGKTTTVEMVESIREPTSGVIKLLGNDISTDFNSVKEKIGILPQEFHSFERLTVLETLQYFSYLYKKKAEINDIIQSLDLVDHKNMLYRNLSGGLKQRVGVAIALVNDPEIIFLDEPTTGLDPKARREVWGVIAGLRKKGKTVFLTTHYMEEAEFLADHIAVIHKGRIIAEGSLEDLIRRYGKSSILNIKKCKDAAGVIAMLKQEGFTDVTSQGNGDIAIKIDYKERVLEILAHLRHDCIEYDSIDIRRSNLEEVFLRLTGSKLTEDEK
jgi:ABC-2 type transport system ATP-binding protein